MFPSDSLKRGPSAMEAPGAAPFAKKSRNLIPCRHFVKGFCNMGTQCSFLHTKNGEVPSSVALPIPEAETAPPSAPPSGYEAAPGAQPAVAPNFRTTTCKHWLQGTCTKGDYCTFAHWVIEKAAAGLTAPRPMSHVAPGQPEIPPNFRVTTCKHWRMNACTKGDLCTFAHWEIPEAPRPGMSPAPVPPAAAGYPGSTPHFGQGKGGGAAPFRTTTCRHWRIGKCNKGDFCTFAHWETFGPGAPVGPAFPPPSAIKTQTCRFWLQSKCVNGDQCKFLHAVPSEVHPTPLADPYATHPQHHGGEGYDMQGYGEQAEQLGA